MKIKLLILLQFLLVSALSANYTQSGGRLTINDGTSLFNQDNSVGAQSGARYYAISHQYTHYTGGGCWRRLRFFDAGGNFLATSSAYSHDHGGATKILFDPKNDEVVYALYQERNSATSSSPTWRTYLKRMYRQGSTVVQGPRIEVFNHNNSVDMEVVTNQGVTDLIITGVNDNGGVVTKVYREFYLAGSGYNLILANSMVIAGNGTAAINGGGSAGLWMMDTDMKNNQLVVTYNSGNYNPQNPHLATLNIHRITFIPFGAGLSQSGYFQVADTRLYTNTTISFSMVHQAVGLRSNGEILLLRQTSGTSFQLQKLAAGNSPVVTTLASGSGDANLVVAQNDRAFLARKASSFKIDLYNEHDALAHTYTPTWQLLSGINHLCVLDCQLLASGKHSSDPQYHEFYDCDDCDGGLPTASMEYVNPYATINMNSLYGPQPVAEYCGINHVYVDGSASTCEEGFHLYITEFDLPSWTSTNVLYNGWVPGYTTVPHDLKIADYLPSGYTPSVNQVYMVSIAVASPWHYDNKFFKLKICEARPIIDRKKTFLSETDDWAPKVYPNPNSGNFRLEFEELGDEPVDLSIVNSRGQVIRTMNNVQQKVTEFNLDLAAGMYFIRLRKGAQHKSLKFLVK